VSDAVGTRVAGRRGFTDHALFGMAIFVFTEVMLFAAFTSAFLIIRNTTPPGMWPPADQPRLPFERTAFNTLLLLVSGAFVVWAGRAFARQGATAARLPLSLALVAGLAFVGLQGVEWTGLLAQGLTMTSSQIGGFFYLIVGCHAVHALCALGLLAVCWRGLMTGTLKGSRLAAAQLFWLFVVLVWPVVWLVVYR
jgi:cytochrome c oxidase subunit III